jgi:hypothetical protein
MTPPISGPIASAIADTPARDDRERGGHHDRGADALDGPRADQRPACRREPAGERREREDHEADQEDATPSEEVGQLAAGEHEHGEGEGVGVHRPLELREPDAEVALDGRQRDVHDGVVEHDHEEREGERSQRPPLAVLLGEDPCPHRVPSSVLIGVR